MQIVGLVRHKKKFQNLEKTTEVLLIHQNSSLFMLSTVIDQCTLKMLNSNILVSSLHFETVCLLPCTLGHPVATIDFCPPKVGSFVSYILAE